MPHLDRKTDRRHGYFQSGIPLREALVHMIEEYARHVGHADPPRECIDGRPVQ